MLSRRTIGLLDAVTIGRYATTIGATDPVHHGAVAVGGYADVVAPPNLLAAIVEWGSTPEADLQPDGTPTTVRPVIPASGCGDGRRRRDGVGQPVVAGTELVLEYDALGGHTEADPDRHLRVRHHAQHLHSADGTVLNRNRRTVVLRNPVQES